MITKLTVADIERMLAASPGSTAESLAAGFERRAERQRQGARDLMRTPGTGTAWADLAHRVEEDLAMAAELREYAAELNRLLESAQRAGDNATARLIHNVAKGGVK